MNTYQSVFRILICFFIVVFVLPVTSFAQSNDARSTANQIVSFYKEKNYSGLVDIIYPPIFQGVSKDSLDNLKEDFANFVMPTPDGAGLNHRFIDVNIQDISEVKSADSLSYCTVTIRMSIELYGEDPTMSEDLTEMMEYLQSIFQEVAEVKYDKKAQTLLLSDLDQPFILIKTPSFKKWYWFNELLSMISENEDLYIEISSLMNR